jgi:hypothetical protein
MNIKKIFSIEVDDLFISDRCIYHDLIHKY